MQNYYEMLGVSQDVTPSIAKIAYEGKLKVLGRAEMGEEQRKAEERELTQAFVTLSVPAKKVWYDKQLALQGEREDRAVRSSNRTAWTVAGVVCAFLVAGAGWAYVNRVNERERVRLEEQRIAIEKEKASKAAEIEEARLQLQQDSQDYNQQMDTRRQVAREQAYKDQQSRMAQDRAFQQQVQGRVINTFDERNAQYNEDRQRRMDAEDRRRAEDERRKAQAEVDRQKRYVTEREREDERIRAEREYRVQREQAIKRATSSSGH